MTQVASLAEYLATRRAQIDAALERYLPTPPDVPLRVCDAMRYSLRAGGKRLRPILAITAAETIGLRTGGDDAAERAVELALPTACAIEFIHTYSLIHDDLPAMDDDSMRRGRPTNHVVYGEGMAILAGDGLLTEAFNLMANEPRQADLAARKLRAIATVASAAGAAGMVGGQAIDLTAVGAASKFDLPSLQDMHARKTGALIRSAAVAGAIMAGATEDVVSTIGEFGRHVGLAFQIVDDILDVEGEAERLGKTAGKDARAGKPTYPSVLSLDASRALAADHYHRALSALDSVALRDSRLADIASWVVQRNN